MKIISMKVIPMTEGFKATVTLLEEGKRADFVAESVSPLEACQQAVRAGAVYYGRELAKSVGVNLEPTF
jgi:hypothetical protein